MPKRFLLSHRNVPSLLQPPLICWRDPWSPWFYSPPYRREFYSRSLRLNCGKGGLVMIRQAIFHLLNRNIAYPLAR